MRDHLPKLRSRIVVVGAIAVAALLVAGGFANSEFARSADALAADYETDVRDALADVDPFPLPTDLYAHLASRGLAASGLSGTRTPNQYVLTQNVASGWQSRCVRVRMTFHEAGPEIESRVTSGGCP